MRAVIKSVEYPEVNIKLESPIGDMFVDRAFIQGVLSMMKWLTLGSRFK